jgi:hypothetical protein
LENGPVSPSEGIEEFVGEFEEEFVIWCFLKCHCS